MPLSVGWGAGSHTHTGFTSFTTDTVYRPSAGSYPSGSPRLDGGANNIYAYGISASASGASHNWSISGGAGYKNGGASFQANLNKTGGGQLNFHRNANAGGTIFHTASSATWAGNFVSGSLSYSTAPAAPASISPVISGKKATVSFTAAPNGGGETIIGYTGQYRKNGGAWTGNKDVSTVTPIVWDNLEPGQYEFRVYTRTALFNGAARTSSAFQVKSGGKRNNNGNWVDTSVFKRNNSGFIDITTFKRNDPVNGWVDGGG